MSPIKAAAEIAGVGVSRSELLSPQRVNAWSLHEMLGSVPFGTAETSSDSNHCRNLDPQESVTLPLIDRFDTPDPTDPELPTPDPVYWTAELRDRASSNIADAHMATSIANSQGLQSESNCGKAPPGMDTHGEIFMEMEYPLDEQWARSPFHYFDEEIADIHPSTPSLELDCPMTQITSASIPSPSLISQLSKVVVLSSRISALVCPLSNIGFPNSGTPQIPGANAIVNLEDGINAWRSQSSTLPPPKTKETQLQGCLAKLRTNTTSASDSTMVHRYSSGERQQIPIQIRELGAEVNHDHESYLGTNQAQTRTQVEQLRGLVCIVCSEWMQRLLPSRELHIPCSSLSARTLFAKGIYTLKTWLCGKLERTFEEVFSFMHISFAAAFILHHEDESYCWDSFFQDALQLQHAVVAKEEKLLFLTAMDRWWWLPRQQSTYVSVLMFSGCYQNRISSHVPSAQKWFQLSDFLYSWITNHV